MITDMLIFEKKKAQQTTFTSETLHYSTCGPKEFLLWPHCWPNTTMQSFTHCVSEKKVLFLCSCVIVLCTGNFSSLHRCCICQQVVGRCWLDSIPPKLSLQRTSRTRRKQNKPNHPANPSPEATHDRLHLHPYSHTLHYVSRMRSSFFFWNHLT